MKAPVMFFSPFGNITFKETTCTEEIPSPHSSSIQHFHKNFASNGRKVSSVAVKVALLGLIDIRCICMLEFLGSGTPQVFVSVDSLLKES